MANMVNFDKMLQEESIKEAKTTQTQIKECFENILHSMSLVEQEKEHQADMFTRLKSEFGLDKKEMKKLARLVFKGDFEKFIKEAEALQDLKDMVS